MPGTTVIDSPGDRDAVDDALDAVCFTDAYSRHDVIDDDETIVAHTGYDDYPVEVFDAAGCTIVLEGYLYGTDDVESTVSDVARWLVDDHHGRLAEWVAERDGDFLLLVVDRSGGRTWALNDPFGRLPTYYATIGETTILTRELKVVRELARATGSELDSDRLGLGQLLLFGYPLGSRTLFDGVEQLPPGSLLELEAGRLQSLYEFRFDRYANEDRSVESNAEVLRDRFLEACANRSESVDETVVSLSGGLDSRAVLAGYEQVDGSVTAATSARADGGNAAEVDVARQVAGAFDAPWSSYVASRTDRHQDLLLEATQGMNNAGMSIGLDFAEQVAAERDAAMVVTGDGGDKAMPALTPTEDLETTGDLVDAILAEERLFSPAEVAAIADVDADDLVDSVRDVVDSYPETTLDGTYAGFLVRERAFNWLNHGEDRTRYYLWSTTPFYSLPFFTAAMACPPSQKRGTRLYREFLSQLDPATVEIEYVDYGASIDSLEYRIKRYGYDWLTRHPALKDRLSGFLTGNGDERDLRPVRGLAEATRRDGELEPHVSRDEIHQVAWNHDDYSNEQRYVLFTAVAALLQPHVAESG